MRVLILTSEFPPGPGGIGTHAHQLALNLHKRGWEVAVLAVQDYASEEAVEAFRAAQSFEVIRWRRARTTLGTVVLRYRVMMRSLRAFLPDVVVASGQRATWLASWASSGKVPWAAVGHATEFGPGSGWPGKATRWAFNRADGVVFVSAFTRDLAKRAGILPRSHEVIPNGADGEVFRELGDHEVRAFQEECGVSARRVLLTVGNVSERKGQEVVVRALPRIVARVPDVLYVMVGLPTLRDSLTRLAQRLGVESHIRFTGPLPQRDVVRWMNACELFVMTSRTTSAGDCEGFGIAVVEAALCGKPAVVSDGSGLSEAIEAGETGLSVPQGSNEETAEAVLELLCDRDKRALFAKRARDAARLHKTWDTRMGRYDDYLRRIFERRARAA